MRILIIGGFINKTNALLNEKCLQPDIHKTYLYAKDSFKAKYQSLINKRKGEGLKYYNDSRAFIESSNNVDDIYKTTEEYNLNKGRKILIVFHDMITDMLFIRGRK